MHLQFILNYKQNPNFKMNDTHIVIFPLPLQGPINCYLKLAHLILSLTPSTVSITFVTTDTVAAHLSPRHLATFGARFRFKSFPDGLGLGEEPYGSHQIGDLADCFAAQALTAGSSLRKLLTHGDLRDQSCIIADGLFWFMVDVAKEVRVPLVYFETISPSGLWTYLCVPKMVQLGELPFQGDNLDAKVTSVEGMEDYLRQRDLPHFCRAYDPNDQIIQLILKQAKYYPKAQAHILNTFDDLEPGLLSQIFDLCPNLYTVGPLHSLCKVAVDPTTLDDSSSFWAEDRTCLTWLDAQPSKSVLFVSIGSLAVMTWEQLIEFWHGLIDSKTRFLWVRRPGSITGHDGVEIPLEVEEGTRERGLLVNWAPQEEVLAHRAIGGFLTHSGWNSTLESIAAGVPMLCWPFFVDQQVNSRVVSEVWRVGLDMKDTCDRVIIEKMIRELMGNDQFVENGKKLAKLAAKAISEEGTSYYNLNRLIYDIQHKRIPMPTHSDIV